MSKTTTSYGGDLVNIPNIITAIRFALIPVFGYCLYNKIYLVAVLLFIIGGLTDVLDGYIARRFNMVTSWGKLADPAADKLMQITALLLLTMQNLLPVFILLVVIAKETFMGLGSILLYKKQQHVVSANWYGKLATVIFYFAIIMTIFMRMNNIRNAYVDIINGVIIGVAVLSTLYAFIMYSFAYRSIRQGK